MEHRSYRDESRKNYGTTLEGSLNLDQINTGCFLRIADSMEVMIRDRVELENKLKRAEESRDRYLDWFYKSERKNAALRSVITKLKNKLK